MSTTPRIPSVLFGLSIACIAAASLFATTADAARERHRALSVTPPTGGKITDGVNIDCGGPGGACRDTYELGQAVTLTASAGAGFAHKGWTGACAGETKMTCTVVMSESKTVSATFAPTH